MPKYEKAAECLAKDRQALLAFYEFPAEHWKHLRTSNPIESTFATVRHRTIRSKGCLSNKTALAMWCSSLSTLPRKDGAGSMATTSCPSSFRVSGLPTGSKSPPTRRHLSPRPPPPEPSGHHQDSAIAPGLTGRFNEGFLLRRLYSVVIAAVLGILAADSDPEGEPGEDPTGTAPRSPCPR